MDAWVYLFSKFTHEALLFEALTLCLGLFAYAVFYLIRKRKYGIAGKEVPSNIMKVYLAQLMGDADDIRTQLFGLLGKGEASARIMSGMQFTGEISAPSANPAAGAVAAGTPATSVQLVEDPKIAEKLRELEKNLTEQAGALDSVLNEKMKLEEELANAKAATKAAQDKPADKGAAERAPLQERVKQLEAQLAEYAIIEDDLANLKRLQKENKSLKQQVASAGLEPAAVAPAAAASRTALPDPAGPSGDEIATESVHAAHPHDDGHPNDFESLVDVVEKNLADKAKSDKVDLNAAKPAPEFTIDAGGPTEMKADEKSEEQLQADFEKMLKS